MRSNIMKRKILAALFVAVVSIGAVGATSVAAEARDTSWGCGGYC
jgi:hypothetical protein